MARNNSRERAVAALRKEQPGLSLMQARRQVDAERTQLESGVVITPTAIAYPLTGVEEYPKTAIPLAMLTDENQHPVLNTNGTIVSCFWTPAEENALLVFGHTGYGKSAVLSGVIRAVLAAPATHPDTAWQVEVHPSAAGGVDVDLLTHPAVAPVVRRSWRADHLRAIRREVERRDAAPGRTHPPLLFVLNVTDYPDYPQMYADLARVCAAARASNVHTVIETQKPDTVVHSLGRRTYENGSTGMSPKALPMFGPLLQLGTDGGPYAYGIVDAIGGSPAAPSTKPGPGPGSGVLGYTDKPLRQVRTFWQQGAAGDPVPAGLRPAWDANRKAVASIASGRTPYRGMFSPDPVRVPSPLAYPDPEQDYTAAALRERWDRNLDASLVLRIGGDPSDPQCLDFLVPFMPLIVTGEGGTGKTTLVHALMADLLSTYGPEQVVVEVLRAGGDLEYAAFDQAPGVRQHAGHVDLGQFDRFRELWNTESARRNRILVQAGVESWSELPRRDAPPAMVVVLEADAAVLDGARKLRASLFGEGPSLGIFPIEVHPSGLAAPAATGEAGSITLAPAARKRHATFAYADLGKESPFVRQDKVILDRLDLSDPEQLVPIWHAMTDCVAAGTGTPGL